MKIFITGGDHDLADNIRRLISDHVLRSTLGINGQKYASENLDLKTKESELENIYDQLIELPCKKQLIPA